MEERTLVRDDAYKGNNAWVYALLSILIVAVIFLFVSRIFVMQLASPDDILFEKILSGEITGKPDSHCYFISYHLSLILSFLYRLVKGVHWYELYLVFSLIFSLFTFFYRVKDIREIRNKVIYLILIGTVILSGLLTFLINIEWNTVTGITISAGLFFYLTTPKGRHTLDNFISFALVFTALGLRKQMVLMFLPLFFLSVFIKLFLSSEGSLKDRLIKNKSHSITLVAILLAVLGVYIFHSIGYSSEKWKEYATYTTDRSTMNDYFGYPDYESNEEVYNRAGIDREEYLLIEKDYNYLVAFDDSDEIVFAELADVSKKDYYMSIRKVIGKMFSTFKNLITMDNIIIFHILSGIVLGAAMLIKRDIKDDVLVFLGIAWGALLLLYFCFKGRLPYRISSVIELGVMVTSGAVILNNVKDRECTLINDQRPSFFTSFFRIITGLISLCFVMSLCIFNVKVSKDKNRVEIVSAETHKKIVKFCQENPDKIFIRDFDSYSQQGKLLFDYEGYFSPNYIVSGGWLYNSPLYDTQLIRLEYDNIEQIIKEKDNVYYLANENKAPDVIKRLNNYFIGHNIKLRARLFDEITIGLSNMDIIRIYYI